MWLTSGKTYELPITDNSIKASDLGKIKDADGEVLRSYDPGCMNTVSCVRGLKIDFQNFFYRWRQRNIRIQRLSYWSISREEHFSRSSISPYLWRTSKYWAV